MAKVSRATTEGAEDPPKKSSRPEFIYFVSYRWWNIASNSGYGNREHAAGMGLTTIEDIRFIEKEIQRELGCDGVIVISYLYLRHASVKPVAEPETAEPKQEAVA